MCVEDQKSDNIGGDARLRAVDSSSSEVADALSMLDDSIGRLGAVVEEFRTRVALALSDDHPQQTAEGKARVGATSKLTAKLTEFDERIEQIREHAAGTIRRLTL